MSAKTARFGGTPLKINFCSDEGLEAVKAPCNFDVRGIADLEGLRERDASLGLVVEQLIEIRDIMNAALLVEGETA